MKEWKLLIDSEKWGTPLSTSAYVWNTTGERDRKNKEIMVKNIINIQKS